MKALSIALLACLLLTPPAGTAAGQQSGVAPDNPFDRDNVRLAAQASREGRRPEGMLPLLELWQRWDDATPERTLALLEKLAGDPRLSPARAVEVRALLASARVRTGAESSASEAFEQLGYITSWRVIGPFDNEGKTGFDALTAPEEKRLEAPDLQASYPGRERPVSWRDYPAISRGGHVSFGSVMRPRQNVCALAETFVHSERKQALSLWVGAGGAVKVYWNGEEVLRDEAYRLPNRDRAVTMVGAHAGDNRLLVKVCVQGSAWGFNLRLGDASGGVAEGLQVKTTSSAALDIPQGHAELKLPPPPEASLAALEARAQPGPGDKAGKTGKAGKASQVGKPSKANQTRARALADLAKFLRYTGADDPAERRAKQLATHAADLDPSVDNLELAAALAEERGEVQRFGARAIARSPDDPNARLLQASVLADGPTPEVALPLLESIPAGGTAWPKAQLLKARILRDRELPSASLRLVRGAVERIGESVRLLSLLASLEHSVGNVDRSLALHRRILELRSDADGSRRVLIADALNRGEKAETLEHLAQLVEGSPGGLRTLRYVADTYDALGRDDLALSTYRRAMAIVPESAPIHVAYGKTLLRAGQPELAADAFFTALELKPQDAATRELLEQIKPRPRLDEGYALASDALLALRRDSNDYPSTVLNDLTVKTVFDNGLGSAFHQFAAQAHDTEGARRYRTYSIQYDPDTQRIDLRLARVYRKNGRVLESVRTYEQQLGEPWYRIYYDTRAMVVVFPDLEPGDVIELRYRIDDVAHRNLFADYYGDLHPWRDYTPKVRSEYVLITPVSREFYVNEPNLEGLTHERTIDGERRIDHYLARDIPAVVAEAGMPGITETSPYLHVSTYKTWEEVGRWYWGLIADQLYADAALKERVRELVEGASSQREKVQRIHNWVVQNTRYVGLEFGIHGFLPYRVPLIVQRGFGDCKDKASLMYTMLREAGIDARIVLVRTRRNGKINDLPASLAVFDHAIAYVPELDLYLDGTAEHSGTRELPVQDQGVTVLLVGPDGAELRTTPVTAADDNERSRKLTVALAADGSARVAGDEVVRGAEAAGYRSYYQAAGTRAERFTRALGSIYPGLSLETQHFSPLRELESPVEYSYEIRVPQLAHWDGDELRLAPSVLSDLVRSMARLPSRKHTLDLEGNRAYVEDRSIELPKGMVAAELPRGGEATSPFGSLKLAFEKTPTAIRAHTEFQVTRDRVTPQDYPAFRRWVEQADRLLRQRIGIRKDEDRP